MNSSLYTKIYNLLNINKFFQFLKKYYKLLYMNKYSNYASFNSDLAIVSNNIIETMTNTELEMSGNLSVEGTLKASKFMTADGNVIDINDAHKKIKEIKDTHVTTLKHNQLKDELLKADELLTKKSDFDNLRNEVSELKNSNISNEEVKELRAKIESAKSTNLGPRQVIGTGNEKMVIGNMGHSSWAGIGHEKINMDVGMSKLNYALLQHHDGVTNLNSSKGKPINFTQADVKKMVLSPEGNLGIGIDRPKHKLEVNGFIKSHGTDIILDNKARRGGKGGSARRALVHDFGDKLTINYEGDYKGGVKINGNIDANGGVGVKNDIHFTGGNNWTLHTPDDKRHILYLAPSTAYGNENWNWGKQTRFHPNGNIDTRGTITANNFVLNDGTVLSKQSSTSSEYSNSNSMSYFESNRNGVEGRHILSHRSYKPIQYSWGTSHVGYSGKSNNVFIRFSGFITCNFSGNVQFRFKTDDGARLYFNDKLIINSWKLQGPTYHSSRGVKVVSNVEYPFYLEWYEHGGGATIQLEWKKPGKSWQVIPKNAFSSRSLKYEKIKTHKGELDYMFEKPIKGRFIQIMPQSWQQHMSFRFDVYVDGVLQNNDDSKRSYSSIWGGGNYKKNKHARSSLNGGQAWSSQHNSKGEWTRLDLGSYKNITGIRILGRDGNNKSSSTSTPKNNFKGQHIKEFLMNIY